MVAYQETYELLQLHLDDIPKDVLLSIFVQGLNEQISAELMVESPLTL